MFWKDRRIVFADEALEADFRRLAESEHRDDKKVHSVLKSIRMELLQRWRSGQRITRGRMALEYRKRYQVSNVWRLRLYEHGTAIYSVSRTGLQILDIL